MSDEKLNDIIPSASFDSPFDEDLVWKTLTSPTEGGKEYRYKKWMVPKRSWKIIADARNNIEINDIWAFYNRMCGAFDTFKFENPNESPVYEATGRYDVFTTGDGVEKHWYLGVNKFSIGTGDISVISGSVTVQRSVGGTGDWLTYSTFTVQPSFGKIVTTTPIGSGDVLRGDYRFMYTARFANDKMSRRAFAYKLWASEIELIQVI